MLNESHSSGNSLLSHAFGMADHAVIRALHDAPGPGKLSPGAHEVGIHVAGGLAALVDSPGSRVSPETNGTVEETSPLTKQ
jgi:hypothetical protein